MHATTHATDEEKNKRQRNQSAAWPNPKEKERSFATVSKIDNIRIKV